jgi:pseudouridine-5'-phosphate glycosidase
VVAAGAKAILDLPKTLEVLETLGVPVIAVGQDAFPAFWSRDSGLRAAPLDTAGGDRARAPDARRARPAGRAAGGQPDPARRPRSPPDLAPLIAEARREAEAEGITGKAVTPFLLQWLFERTGAARWRPISPLC